jgi:hypothetical protein
MGSIWGDDPAVLAVEVENKILATFVGRNMNYSEKLNVLRNVIKH